MIWNWFKVLFWCGVFHETKVVMDIGDPDEPPTERDIGQHGSCVHCGAVYEIT